ncbi:thioredoxin family protein [Chryseobacterium daecheongense]|uniref:thioredoxin family protein n=1 Tax=Chryseobacterium daecheongense TaxID=192389 RepID=UPI001FD718AE|nr:thioredoxin family protein [Chryseobacterium daecheongense]UOU99002.1 thioredoxin family protein [Chryseobacterium daecheongense]
MKTIISAFLWAVFSIFVHAQSRFDKAQKDAADHHKLIVLNFSGSDWCVPCIKLHKNIIDTESFKQLSTDNMINYINADFPRNKKNQLSPEMKKENALLADQYNAKGLFPYTLLLDSQGKILKTWEGLPAENASAFCKEIKDIYQQKK